MEMGGGSGGNGGSASCDSSSLNGLKFGKKIYFEDVGAGVSAKTSGGLLSISASGAGSSGGGRSGGRKGRVGSQGGGVPRCLVEGCRVDLSGVKAYYSRHKVCSMHSKTPKVIVDGVEQRFCQQCSRFHLLAEFDQEKRSCRRRLAGHNERRRKPQPVPLFPSHYSQLLPTSQGGSSSRQGGFAMDFTAHPRMTGRDVWPAIKSGNWKDGNQPTPTGKLLPHQWHSSTGNPPPVVYPQTSHPHLQCAARETVYSGSKLATSERLAGVADSSCALSLLSWISKNQTPTIEVNTVLNGERISMAQSTSHSALLTSFANGTWSLKDENDINESSHEMQCRFGLDQVSQQSVTDHFPGELELAQQGGRQYMELGQARDIGSSPQRHWSL